jgi:hypothetical protein
MMADKGSTPASISRRHLLTAAAGAGATVAVVGVAGGAPVGTVATPPASAGRAAVESADPVVVHLRDLASGALDVFSGTERIQIHDRALADRIAQAATSADKTNGSR